MSHSYCLWTLLLAASLVAANDIRNLAPNTWVEIPNSKIRSCVPSAAQYPAIQASSGPKSIIGAWNGGLFDTKRDRFIVWGGGHADYYGNEVYAFDLGTLGWTRITDPYPAPVMNIEENPDGTPNSRHNYGGNAYIAHADRFFTLGGSLAGMGSAPCTLTWTFDFDSLRWSNRKPATRPTVSFGATSSYDPESRLVYWGSLWGFWSYNHDSNRWTRLAQDFYFYEHNSCIDTKRGLFIAVGNGRVVCYDIRNKNWKRQLWATTGDTSGITGKPGVDYDPVNDRIVAWKGGDVYGLNPDTKAWTVHHGMGKVSPCASNGTYGRWRYVPSLGAFITVGHIDSNVFLYKLPSPAAAESPVPLSRTSLLSASPNPFQSATRVTLGLPWRQARSRLNLFDPMGRLISSYPIAPGPKTATFILDGCGLAAGRYLAVWESCSEKRAIPVLKME